MPYESNDELPTQVRLALTDEQQTKWREYYNAHTGPWPIAKRDAWRTLANEDSDVRWFGAWASVQVEDGHGTIFDIDAMARCMPTYVDNGGEVALMHRAGTYGTVFDYDVREHPEGKVGIYVTGALYKGQEKYDRLWEALSRRRSDEGQVMLGLSIGAFTAEGMHWICDDELCEYRLVTEDIKEFSITDSPSNPLALGYANGKARTEERTMTEEEHIENREEDANPLDDALAQVRDLSSRVDALEGGQSEIRSSLESGFSEIRSMLEQRQEPEDEEDDEEEDSDGGESRSLHSEEFAEFKETTERTIEELRTQLLQATTHTPAPFAKVETASYGEGDTEAISRVFFGRK